MDFEYNCEQCKNCESCKIMNVDMSRTCHSFELEECEACKINFES